MSVKKRLSGKHLPCSGGDSHFHSGQKLRGSKETPCSSLNSIWGLKIKRLPLLLGACASGNPEMGGGVGVKIAVQEGSDWHQGSSCLLQSGGIRHQRELGPEGCWVTGRVTVCGQPLSKPLTLLSVFMQPPERQCEGGCLRCTCVLKLLHM